MDRVRAGRALLLSLPIMLVLLATAGPAGAAGLGPVLAEAKPWHYWASFVLLASTVGLFLMMILGYLVKVTAMKYGIKIGRKSAG